MPLVTSTPVAFDLQCHSRHSDGALTPTEVVEHAATAGVELLALSDHDTVDGVAEALEAGSRNSVRVLPAVELSAVHEGAEDFHLLGYLIDHDDAVLAERLDSARGVRAERIKLMGTALVQDGWRIFDLPIARRAAAGQSLGRPHLAAAVLAHKRNAKRLAAEEIDDVSTFIAAYLVPGRAGYVRRTQPTAAEAIGWVHDAGGVAVWAHPFWDMRDPPAVRYVLECLADVGLDGVEAFYPTHDAAQATMLAAAASELGLLATGSSDFHGPEHRIFNAFRAFSTHGLEPRLGALLASG